MKNLARTLLAISCLAFGAPTLADTLDKTPNKQTKNNKQTKQKADSSTQSEPAKKKTKKPPRPFAWVNKPSQETLRKTAVDQLITHHSFESGSMGVDVGYCIYLPEAYAKFSDRKFPVVFHLHGGRPGSEAKSIKLAKFVHAAVEAGDIQPTIYVFPNGGPVSWYNYPQKPNAMGEDVFVEELIPHIRSTYRTRELAIEGFSQGGRGTTRIMFRHPELFVSAAPGGSGYEPEQRIQQNDGAESESLVFAAGYNAWDLANEYAKRSDKTRLPIMLWVGSKGFNYEYNLKFSGFLKDLGIPHEVNVAEGVEHSAVDNYHQTGTRLMEFHQKSFAMP
ncbi:MAG: alpha/beta hydrolase [Rubripirellula sp.]